MKSNIYQGQHQYQSFPQAVVSIFRSGPRGLFKGFLPSAIRDAPYAGIFVATYEAMKRETCEMPDILATTLPNTFIEVHLTNSTTTPVPPTVVHVLSAGCAGAFATFVTHPFDVMKVRRCIKTSNA